MTVEIISRSISTKVWDRAGIELATPGIAVGHASVAKHVTDCATRPGKQGGKILWTQNRLLLQEQSDLGPHYLSMMLQIVSLVDDKKHTFCDYAL